MASITDCFYRYPQTRVIDRMMDPRAEKDITGLYRGCDLTSALAVANHFEFNFYMYINLDK